MLVTLKKKYHHSRISFGTNNFNLVGNCDPQCPNCPASDDNLHRLFVCPLFNSAFRDTLQQHSIFKHPSWSILSDQSKESSKAFRCLAQLAITDETQVPLVPFLSLFPPSSISILLLPVPSPAPQATPASIMSFPLDHHSLSLLPLLIVKDVKTQRPGLLPLERTYQAAIITIQ